MDACGSRRPRRTGAGPSAAVAVALAVLGVAPAAGAAGPPPPLRLRAVPEAAPEDGGPLLYRVVTNRGDALTQRHFAELAASPQDVAAIDARDSTHRTRGTVLAVASGASALGGMSAIFWSTTIGHAHREAVFDSVFIGGLGAGLVLALLAYRDFSWLADNEEALVPSDPYFSLDDAKRLCATFDARAAAPGGPAAGAQMTWSF